MDLTSKSNDKQASVRERAWRGGPRKICNLCGARLAQDQRRDQTMKTRWKMAIAAAVGAAITSITESAVLGTTIADLIAGLL